MHGGIIHGNQRDRNSGGAIWSRDDFRDGVLLSESFAGRILSFEDQHLDYNYDCGTALTVVNFGD